MKPESVLISRFLAVERREHTLSAARVLLFIAYKLLPQRGLEEVHRLEELGSAPRQTPLALTRVHRKAK